MQFFEDLEQESWLLYSPNFRIKEEKERTIPLVLAGLIEKKKLMIARYKEGVGVGGKWAWLQMCSMRYPCKDGNGKNSKA